MVNAKLNKCVFSLVLNESNKVVQRILSGRLFQVAAAVFKAMGGNDKFSFMLAQQVLRGLLSAVREDTSVDRMILF